MNGNQKKAAIVTGASSGIGKAIAEMLVSLGYEVFGFGREFTAEYLFIRSFVTCWIPRS